MPQATLVKDKWSHHCADIPRSLHLMALLSFHSGMRFSTKDQDNDIYSGSCAMKYKGAWWYKHCHASNINGQYLGGSHVTPGDGINWWTFRGDYYSLKRSEMKLRPQQWQKSLDFFMEKCTCTSWKTSALLRIYGWIIISSVFDAVIYMQLFRFLSASGIW